MGAEGATGIESLEGLPGMMKEIVRMSWSSEGGQWTLGSIGLDRISKVPESRGVIDKCI